MVDQPKFTLDFSDKRLLENQPQIDRQILSFVVYSADNQDNNSWRYGLTRINGTTAEQVQTEVQFFKDVISPMTFLDDLIMATYYEEKGLLLDALTTYENLMKKAPGIEGFEMLYNSFVWRRLQKIQTREMGG